MQSFMSTLLICSIAMSVIAIIYMLATPLLEKRYSEKWRYYAWLVIVFGLIIPFRPQFTNRIIQVEIPNERIVVFVGSTISSGEPHDMSFTALPARTSFFAEYTLSAVWFIGMAGFLSHHVIKHYRFTKTIKRWSDKITDEQILSSFQHIKDDMGVYKTIEIYKCPCIGSPMLIGLRSPRILLPDTDLKTNELMFVLKHELMHYKRKDILYKCLILTATAIHWFNPVVYVIAKAISSECEASCDADVVRGMDQNTRYNYIKTIIGMIKYQSEYRTVLSTNFYGGKKYMKKRISSIMNTSKKRMGIAIPCALVALTIGVSAVFAEPNEIIVPANPNSNVHLEEFSANSEYVEYADNSEKDKYIVEISGIITDKMSELSALLSDRDDFDYDLVHEFSFELIYKLDFEPGDDMISFRSDLDPLANMFTREFTIGNYIITIGLSDEISILGTRHVDVFIASEDLISASELHVSTSEEVFVPNINSVSLNEKIIIAYEKFFNAMVEEGIKTRAEADETLQSKIFNISNPDITAAR